MTIKLRKRVLVTILLSLILLLAAFLRLYRIRDYIVFLGDQGRDALVAKRIIVDHKLTLLGPTASVGGFYLGPFYYYLMTIPLWLAGFDPVGPAIMVAFLGICSVFFIYYFIKKNFGFSAAFFASCLYTFSPLVVYNTRFSWNPNTVPFFSLSYFYSLYLARKKKKPLFLFLAGLILGICFQLHYLAFILAPLGVILIFRKEIKVLFLDSLLLISGAFISFSPFLFFELRHSFTNLKAILEFVTRRGGAVAFYPLDLFSRVSELSQRFLASIFGLEKGIFIKTLVFLSFLTLLLRFREKREKWATFILLVWWLLGIAFLSFYRGTIYNYYYGYLYPVLAMTLGLSLDFLWRKKFLLSKFFSLAIFVVVLFYSFKKQPIWQPPNRILEQTKRITESIIERSGDKPFNFALISKNNSDFAYRYFLEIAGHKTTSLGDLVEGQLFVVCEDEECKPLGYSLWEIAAFGRAEIVESWTDKVGITIFKLVHHPDSQNWVGKPAPKGI